MNIVKLDRRHKLHREGFRYAIRTHFSAGETARLEAKIRKIYGGQYKKNSAWQSTFGKYDREVGASIYWIGFKSEATLSHFLLTI